MITKNDIINFVRHVHRKGRGLPDRRLMHPRREWLIGVICFLFVTTVGASYSMIMFNYYQQIDNKTYTVELKSPTYKENVAQRALTYFSEREAKFNALTSQPIILPATPVTDVASATDTATTTDTAIVGVADSATTDAEVATSSEDGV